MPTTNLGLEELLLSDKLKTEFVQKINKNMQKLDTKYSELKQLLLDRTQQDNLQSAIALIEQMFNTKDATITEEDVKLGKIAYGSNGKIEGNYNPWIVPTINVKLTGNSTYMGYITAGAGIDDTGRLIIWAMSNTGSYENIYFVASNLGIGTAENGFGITAYGTGNPANSPFACTVTGFQNCKNIEVTLNASAVNSSYDYVQLDVSIITS